jgi:FixJ family two-component response regulator
VTIRAPRRRAEAAAYASAEALPAGGVLDRATCIICDFKLPAMPGLGLLTALRVRGASPPFILVTAHDSRGVRGEAERLGAAACLAKPFTGRALLDAIEGASSQARK